MQAENPQPYVVTVDDDPIVGKLIEKVTKMKSINYTSVKDLVKNVDQHSPVAAFIDVHLGEAESGIQLVPFLREKWPFCPIIVVTGDAKEAVLSHALSSGADDFITKPIRPAELVARLQLRLADQAQKASINAMPVGNLTFYLQYRMLSGDRGQRFLSTTESNLLTTLVQAKGMIVPRDTLKLKCWGPIRVSDGALDRKIYEVRRALEELGGNTTIRTAYGVGFGMEYKEVGQVALP